MDCFGIGVTRLLASSVEILSTDDQLRWPKLLAPFQICIIPQKVVIVKRCFLQSGGKTQHKFDRGLTKCFFFLNVQFADELKVCSTTV